MSYPFRNQQMMSMNSLTIYHAMTARLSWEGRCRTDWDGPREAHLLRKRFEVACVREQSLLKVFALLVSHAIQNRAGELS